MENVLKNYPLNLNLLFNSDYKKQEKNFRTCQPANFLNFLY